eukprot:365672-Chlamydomonas_euryale.AAC.8
MVWHGFWEAYAWLLIFLDRQFTYGVKTTGVAVKFGLLTSESRTPPPGQEPSHLVILMGIPTCTPAHWAAARSHQAAMIPVIEAFNPYVNWPLGRGGMRMVPK